MIATPKRKRLAFILIGSVIAIAIAIAVMLLRYDLARSKERVLRQTLFTLGIAIDEYAFDEHKAPQALDDLVSERYLRAVPADPITGSSHTWSVVMEDAASAIDRTHPGILEIHSGSDRKSLQGTPYSAW